MTAEELEADTAAQNELFEMARKARSRQEGFGGQMISNDTPKARSTRFLKRSDFDGFIAGEKARRAPRVWAIPPDIVRGRFNMARLNDVN